MDIDTLDFEIRRAALEAAFRHDPDGSLIKNAAEFYKFLSGGEEA